MSMIESMFEPFKSECSKIYNNIYLLLKICVCLR